MKAQMDTDWEMQMGYGNEARIGNGKGGVVGSFIN